MSDKIVVSIDKDLEEIIPQFLDNRRKDLDKISAALLEENISEIQIIAHKLAGNAGSYGFTDLSQIGSRMEDACKANDTKTIETEFESFKDYMARLEVNYG